jgi:hypothetical protein
MKLNAVRGLNPLSKIKPVVEEEEKHNVPTVAALQSSSQSNSATCGFCDKRHVTDRCWDVTKLGIVERKDKIRKSGLYFHCLSRSHMAKSCNAWCSGCCGKHHQIICSPGTSRNRVYDIAS